MRKRVTDPKAFTSLPVAGKGLRLAEHNAFDEKRQALGEQIVLNAVMAAAKTIIWRNCASILLDGQGHEAAHDVLGDLAPGFF